MLRPPTSSTLLLALLCCDQGVAARAQAAVDTREMTFARSETGPQRVVIMIPRHLRPGERLPLLVALHGQGESRRGVARGAWGWLTDYELAAADAALRRGALRRSDFHDFVERTRLADLNRSLADRPYRGLVVACPFTNDLFADPTIAGPFDRFVVRELLPRLRRELPVATGRGGTGIDGVSLGGIQALLVGLAHPDEFAAVGGMQPAVRGRIPELVRRARARRIEQRLRLVSSSHDPFLPLVQRLSGALGSARVAHSVLVTPGPHDYVWNQGPGGIEMLLSYDRVLRGEPE